MAYTSSMIYQKQNKFMRETSVALFPNKEELQKYWPYECSNKLIKSLLKLPNHPKKVYRGIKQVNDNETSSFSCNEGEILEWTAFTSTTLKFENVPTFIGTDESFIFEITQFTGKKIA